MAVAARLSLFYFAYFAFVGAFVPYFPLYLADRGLAAAQIAAVLALPQLARIIAPGFWGWVADRRGARYGVVVLSCAAPVASFALLPITPGFAGIAVLVALMSALSAGGLPLVEAITLSALAGRSGHYGPIRLWGSVGFIGAVLAAGAWLDTNPVRTLPAVLLGLSLAALVASLLLPDSRVLRAATADPRPETLVVGPSVRALIEVGFCMAVAHGALYAFFTLHLEHLGYSGKTIGALWTLGVLAEILVFVYLPALFRRWSLASILKVSLLAAVIRFLAIGWAAEHVAVLVVAQLLHAATFGAFHSASIAAVHRLFPPLSHARGQALFSGLSYGAGGAIGSLLAGWTWKWGGAALTFTMAAAAAFAGTLLVTRLKRAGL